MSDYQWLIPIAVLAPVALALGGSCAWNYINERIDRRRRRREERT